MTIEKNLQMLKTLITDCEKKYGRELGSVSLLAASKGQSSDKIKVAYAAGQRQFGENYLQEALKKMSVLAPLPIEWHFIGQVQSNKTKKIAEHFTWVHSVTNEKMAQRLNNQRPPHLPPINICLEINISHEETKSGIKADELLPLANYCLTLPNIKLRGLMAIPAEHKNFIEQRKEFHKLFSIWQTLRDEGVPLDTLSMGMSGDFAAAIAEGSTIIRVGTAIFGER